ncbi:MAG: NUDIX hydrolase [Lachnospiraceae bacterium]|nr:NUDIX hydrolase [Lachnospiraceae bacterium]
MSDNKKKDPLSWEKLSTEHIINDQWIDFKKSAFRFPDGKVYEPFYTYTKKDYAVIVATDTDGNYICVRRFRQGIEKVTTEFPAGGIERKELISVADPAEAAFSAAKRELLEEAGYESDEWEHLLTIPANPTISDNYAYLFKASNCRKVSEQTLDETEYLNVVILTPAQIEHLIKEGEFVQADHIVAWFMGR